MIATSVTSLSGFLEAVYIPERIDLADGTVAQLRVVVRMLSRYLGHDAKPSDLSRETMLAWMRALRQDRSPATVNSKRRAIVAVWNAAAEQGLCSPPHQIPKLSEPRRIPVAWTMPEVDRIFAAVSQLDGEWSGVPVALCWRIALLVFWDTGNRLNPVIQARLSQVDLEAGTMLVPAENIKGRREDRLYSLHTQTVDSIRASLPSGREKLFPFPWGITQVWRHLKKILRSAGLPHDSKRMFHCLRRSAESHAAAQRGIEWAAAAVGHGVGVARKSYISPAICRPPSLVDALPRPKLSPSGERQLTLF